MEFQFIWSISIAIQAVVLIIFFAQDSTELIQNLTKYSLTSIVCWIDLLFYIIRYLVIIGLLYVLNVWALLPGIIWICVSSQLYNWFIGLLFEIEKE